jgi:hypothetical protein
MKVPVECIRLGEQVELCLGDLLIPGTDGIATISSVHDAAIKFANKSRVPLMKVVAEDADKQLLVELV